MKRLFLVFMSLMFIMCLAGCKNNGYSYNFHFRVEGGNGEIKIQTSSTFNPTVHLCNEMEDMCELNCNEGTHFISLLGGKNSFRELTLIAVPDDGYRVKEWIFNGEKVVGNDSLMFTAKVTSELKYNGVIVVKFEKILDKLEDIKVNYNEDAFDYFTYDVEKQTMKYNFDLFYTYEELISYFETPEISNICQFENNNVIHSYFENYYIVHFVSCLGTSDAVEIDFIDGDKLIFNVHIITYTDEYGNTEEGMMVNSYFFLIEKEKIDGKYIEHRVSNESKVIKK